jgi:uncharacterized Zn-binding protein involved in type VI secretion
VVEITDSVINVLAGTVNLGGASGAPVARVGDTIAGTTSGGQTVTGTITAGSSKVKAE